MKKQIIENLALAVSKAILESGVETQTTLVMVLVNTPTLDALKKENPLYVDRDGDFYAVFSAANVAVMFTDEAD